mmetsp:Transcript_545/g.769  ORF Transcript_545/g.769 Transcript_545/m.769 type:complete len:118 (-) Transcript_545:69-422(-)
MQTGFRHTVSKESFWSSNERAIKGPIFSASVAREATAVACLKRCREENFFSRESVIDGLTFSLFVLEVSSPYFEKGDTPILISTKWPFLRMSENTVMSMGMNGKQGVSLHSKNNMLD